MATKNRAPRTHIEHPSLALTFCRFGLESFPTITRDAYREMLAAGAPTDHICLVCARLAE